MTGSAVAPLGAVTVRMVGDDPSTRVAGHWLAEMGTRAHDGAGPVDLVIGAATDLAAAPANGTCVLAFSTPAVGADGAPEPCNDEPALWLRSGLGNLAAGLGDAAAAPPAIPTGPAGSVIAAMAGCVGALATLIGRRSGGPSATRIDVDKLEVLAALPMQPFAAAQLPDAPPAVTSLPPRLVATTDGEVFVGAVEPRQWRALLEVVGLPEHAVTIGDAGEGLPAVRDALVTTLTGWAAARKAAAVVEEFQGRHVPVVAMRRPRDLYDDDHLAQRRFFVPGDDGRRSMRLPWLAEPGAPGAGGPVRRTVASVTDATPAKPLRSVTVLDLTWAWAGPFATTLLADLGAEVINIEWDPRPSNLRMQPPFAAGRPGPDRSGWWSANQRGKLSVGVNLKSAEGVRIVRDLARISDVAIENFSPGVARRLGVGAEDLRRVNPGLVYASMSAFGQSGPASRYVGYGTHLQAASGWMFACGPVSGQPWMTTIPIADPVSGLAGAVAVLAHLIAARETGTGAGIDVSELEAMCWSTVDPLGGAGTSPPDTADPRPAAARPADVLRDRWLDRRGFWVRDDTAAMNGSGVRIAAPMWTFDGRRPAIAHGAPGLFGDTDAVLSRRLGYDPERLRHLHETGAVQ